MARRRAGAIVRPVKGLSDRLIAWWFIAPTILLLLSINIFPLLWTIYLSFTDYRANQPGREIKWIGLRNYERILQSADIWGYLQVTAHFVCWSMFFQVMLGLGLAILINRQFKSHGFWTTLILLPMMLSPAVVGVFWRYLFEPQAGIFNYIVNFFIGAGEFAMIGDVQSGALGDRDGRYLDVDALRHADLSRRAALDSRLHLRGGRGRSRLAVAPVLEHHAAAGAAVPDAGRAVPRRSRTSRCSTWWSS